MCVCVVCETEREREQRRDSTPCPLSPRAFFSPSSAKGKSAKPSSSIAGKKRPNPDTDDTKTADESPEKSASNKGPVTSASESPVFKSKSKRRRVIIDSDDEEEETGGGDGVRDENGGGVRDGRGGGVESEGSGDEVMDTSARELEEKVGTSEEVIKVCEVIG